VLERAKTVHALDRAATVIGYFSLLLLIKTYGILKENVFLQNSYWVVGSLPFGTSEPQNGRHFLKRPKTLCESPLKVITGNDIEG
jgi:hypothetical protein